MHMMIRIIVQAENTIEAESVAERTVETILQKSMFDYGHILSESGRFRSFPNAVRIDSVEGEKTLRKAIDGQKEEFYKAFNEVENYIHRYSDKSLFKEEAQEKDKVQKLADEVARGEDEVGSLVLFRNNCYYMSKNNDVTTFIYYEDGSALSRVVDLEDLKETISDKSEIHTTDDSNQVNYYTVQADMHY